MVALGRTCFLETFTHYDHPQAVEEYLNRDYAPQALADSLANPLHHWRLAEIDGAMVGFVKWGNCSLPIAPTHPPQAELMRLYVLKAFHGYGVGRALMDAALAQMEGGGAGEICLGVWEHNHHAQRFYQRYGFEKVGEYDYVPIGAQQDREWIMRRVVMPLP